MSNPYPNTVAYEWVVEQVDADGDILDCSYWDEDRLANALNQRAAWLRHGAHQVDFGVCWRLGNEAEGEIERAYAYVDEVGALPATLDNGRKVAKRVLQAWEKLRPPAA